jgi:predicted PurR-regulated permease PerM
MQNRIKVLWKEAFGDEDEIIDAYIETFHECEMLLTREHDGKLLAMLHLVPFTAQGCRIAYIYALATATEERGKGHATALINEAISRSKEAGMDAVALIPANEELKDYLGGLVQIMIISIFEYGIVYLIIGHPNAIVLGILAGIANLIPYFGGIINNLIASITAFIISPSLFVKTLIVFFLLSIFDSYVINPHVYGKTNQIHPLITIFALFAGGALFGVMGVFISFPLAIFFVSLIKFYKNDISDGIDKIKESTRKETTV